MDNYTPKFLKRFWKKINVTSNPDDCWNWGNYSKTRGYGRIGVAGKNRFAHRISYEIAFGEIPTGLLVCHRCDNPSCCNPNHLFLGTNGDNNADMMRKGRNAQPKGDQVKHSKLTSQQVRIIREVFAGGGISKAELARQYGVDRSHMCRILKGTNWK